jgi:hypothetical protein
MTSWRGLRTGARREAKAMSAHLHTSFAAALLNPAAPVPCGITATPRRFRVYRNNVVAALVGSLETRFPIATRLVGEEFFRAMAAAFVRAAPPRSPVLLGYGDALPGFVERFESAASLPYLADVMRLEIVRSESFHAADAEPAGAADLARLDPSALGSVRIVPHPAARLLASPHPVATIAMLHAPGAEPAPIDPWLGEDVLVTRPRLTVETHVLPPGAHAFFAALFRGEMIAAAVAAGFDAASSFDPAAALAGLVAGGAAKSLIPEADTDHQGARP